MSSLAESKVQADGNGQPGATNWGIAGSIFAFKEVAKVNGVFCGLCSNLSWKMRSPSGAVPLVVVSQPYWQVPGLSKIPQRELAGACVGYKAGAIPPYRVRRGLLPSHNSGNSMGCS